MSATLMILIGLTWICAAGAGMALLWISHDSQRWDKLLQRETSARCRACIAANPDEDCSECGWRDEQ